MNLAASLVLYNVLINISSNLQEVNRLITERIPHESHVSSTPIMSFRDEGTVYFPIPSLLFALGKNTEVITASQSLFFCRKR